MDLWLPPPSTATLLADYAEWPRRADVDDEMQWVPQPALTLEDLLVGTGFPVIGRLPANVAPEVGEPLLGGDAPDLNIAAIGQIQPGWQHQPMVNDLPFPTPREFVYRHRLAPRRVQFESFGCEHCKRCQRPFSSTSNAEAHFRTAAHGNQNPLFVKYEPKTGRWERFYRRRRA